MAITYALVQSASNQADPASATFGSTPTEGNLLVAASMDRSGTAATSFTINGTGWTSREARTVAQGNGTFRRSFRVWTKIAGASEPTNVQADDGTANTKQLLIMEFEAGAAVTWNFEASASNDNGTTANAGSLATGTTSSVAAGDQILIGLAFFKRLGNAEEETATWATSTLTEVAEAQGGSNGRTILGAFAQESASGAKASTFTYNVSTNLGNNGLGAAILVFSASEGGAETLVVGTGAYTLSGQAVTLSKGDTLAVGAGAYTLTGQDVTLTFTPAPETLAVGTGAYTLTGQAVTLTQAQKLVVGTGAYALTGQNVSLVKVVPGDRTALDFPSNGGSPSAFVAMYLDGADLPNIVPLTLIDRYFPIQQTGYYTKFFHGRTDGSFLGDATYFGTHPYPPAGSSGTVHNWEVSIFGLDDITDENANDTTVVKDRWYRQAATSQNISGDGNVDYYWDLDAGIDRHIHHAIGGAPLVNSSNSPKLFYGDAWWAQQNERLSGYLRGIQVYTEVLSTTHIQALSLLETDAEVLAYCSANSITSLHYLNINPTSADVTDKSGNGRDMQWASGSTASTLVIDFLAVGTGAYVLTGNDVDIGAAKALVVGAGSYALTGQAVNLKQGQALSVGAGAYALTGQDVTLTTGAVAETLVVGTGSYTLTGQDVLLRTDQSIVVGAGAYTLTGLDVGLAQQQKLAVGTGAYTLSGQNVQFIESHRLFVESGAYVLAGQDVTLTHEAANTLLVGMGAYVLTGQDVDLVYTGAGVQEVIDGGYPLPPQKKRGKKRKDDEEEIKQRALLELVAIEHAIEKARKKGKKSNFAKLSLEDIASSRAIAKMAIEDRIELQSKIDAIQQKQWIAREDDEFMQLF